jgi:hypothetical protein
VGGGGVKSCGWCSIRLYRFHNHTSLLKGMVIRCLRVSSYMFVLVLISFSGLHSCVEIFTRGMFSGGDMCLGSYF